MLTTSKLPNIALRILQLQSDVREMDVNPLYSMLECKTAQGSSQMFVQDVKAASYPMCLLGFDWQLDDMARFLTNNHSINILMADTTFNLGDFFVFPLTSPHPLLQDVKTGKPPVMLGPLFVHQKMDFAAFNYIASSLIGIKKELKNILVFGTDGDKALVETFTLCHPASLYCAL